MINQHQQVYIMTFIKKSEGCFKALFKGIEVFCSPPAQTTSTSYQ